MPEAQQAITNTTILEEATSRNKHTIPEKRTNKHKQYHRKNKQ
jgi:hypothetical protein